jgi:hypothetical protein
MVLVKQNHVVVHTSSIVVTSSMLVVLAYTTKIHAQHLCISFSSSYFSAKS